MKNSQASSPSELRQGQDLMRRGTKGFSFHYVLNRGKQRVCSSLTHTSMGMTPQIRKRIDRKHTIQSVLFGSVLFLVKSYMVDSGEISADDTSSSKRSILYIYIYLLCVCSKESTPTASSSLFYLNGHFGYHFQT